MNIKTSFLISLLLITIFTILSCQSGTSTPASSSDDNFTKFTCKYLTLDYPSSWKTQKEKDRLLFYLTDTQDPDLSDPSFHVTFQGSYAQTNSKIFFETLKDFPSTDKKYFQEEIAGKQAMAYRSDGNDNIVNIRYWFDVAPKKQVMIHIAGTTELMELHQPLFEKVKKSIQLIEQPPSRGGKIIEVTNQQLEGEWQEENVPFGPTPGFKISKFEKTIRDLRNGENTIRITDDGTEIKDWNDFFAWKPFSALKDLQIYSYYKGVDEQYRIFGQQVYLGDYDHLLIQQLEGNQVQFDFTKTSGEKVKWIVEYEKEHDLPTNKKIDLNRFTYRFGESFTHTKRMTGQIITFAINGDKYTVRVKGTKVF